MGAWKRETKLSRVMNNRNVREWVGMWATSLLRFFTIISNGLDTM